MVWVSKGEEGNSHEDGKANVCLTKCLLGRAEERGCRDNRGHRVDGADL